MKNKLEEIGLNSSNSIVIGSGILGALNIRESKDIDVVVSKDIYTKLYSDSRFKKGRNHEKEVIFYKSFEIGEDWNVLGRIWTLEDLLDKSTVIDGVRYTTLQFMLDLKRSWLKDKNVRQKDMDDVKLIEKYLD